MKLRLIILFSFYFTTNSLAAAYITRFTRAAATFIADRVGGKAVKHISDKNAHAHNLPATRKTDDLNAIVITEYAASDYVAFGPDDIVIYFADPTCPLIASPDIARKLSKKK